MRDVVVIGGGPAGCAAAITLARSGRAPLLLERDAVPGEKVCGEFLAADAAAGLSALGLDLRELSAVPISRVAIAAGRRDAALPLPFAAWGLPRATLDAALLARAKNAGAEVLLGSAVTEVRATSPLPLHGRGRDPLGAAEWEGEGRATSEAAPWTLRLNTGATLEARTLILATGKHELRGASRGTRNGAIGVKLPLDDVPIEATIALLACPGGYAGLQPRPGGGANLCALDPRAPGVKDAARDATAFLHHVMRGSDLAERLLRDAAPLLAKPMTVANVPYGYVVRGGPSHLFRTGDQASVIPSFCGDGVAMALASGRRAAEAILAGHTATVHHAAWANSVNGAMRLAGVLGALVNRAPGLLVTGAKIAPRLATWAARRTRTT